MSPRNLQSPGRLSLALRALRNRNYRLFFAGHGISLIGTWMQTVATGWLVFRLTGSEFMLGMVAFAGHAPAFVFSPFAGVLGDRFDRRRILMAVQVLAMLQAFALAAVTLLDVVRVWQVALLGFVLGCVNAFEMPSRQAFVVEMIDDRSDLANAIALNSGLFNASRLIGPAVAGILVALAGEGICFTVNGLSFLAALAALVMMKLRPRAEDRPRDRLLSELRKGFGYAFGFAPIRDLLFVVALLTMAAMMFPVLLPVFAGRILSGGSHTYGFLVAASGLGALAGTVFLVTRKTVLGLGRIIAVSLALFGAGLAVFSFSRWLPLSLCILVVVGFGMIGTMTSCNTILQTIVDEDKRGRVMSFYIMVFMGAAPLGSIVSGVVSDAIGAPVTMLGGGLLCLAGASLFALRLPVLSEHIRPVYRRMGILPADAGPCGPDRC